MIEGLAILGGVWAALDIFGKARAYARVYRTLAKAEERHGITPNSRMSLVSRIARVQKLEAEARAKAPRIG